MRSEHTITTERGEYRWNGGAYIDTPDGVALVFEDFISAPFTQTDKGIVPGSVPETYDNFKYVVEAYEEAKEMERIYGDY